MTAAASRLYRIVEIPKRDGTTRRIVVPSEGTKRRLQIALRLGLQELSEWVAPRAHGFVRRRSPVTAALEHVGFACSLVCDIRSFFGGVTYERIVAGLAAAGEPEPRTTEWWTVATREMTDAQVGGLIGGVAAQGLPTSPALANIAGRAVDDAVVAAVERVLGPETADDGARRWAYTRYADDLTISWGRAGQDTGDGGRDVKDVDPRLAYRDLRSAVETAVRSAGFDLHPRKTRLLWSGAGRRVICGVAIGQDGTLHATRRLRRRLRAARHRDPGSHETRGLAGWCAMPSPRTGTSSDSLQSLAMTRYPWAWNEHHPLYGLARCLAAMDQDADISPRERIVRAAYLTNPMHWRHHRLPSVDQDDDGGPSAAEIRQTIQQAVRRACGVLRLSVDDIETAAAEVTRRALGGEYVGEISRLILEAMLTTTDHDGGCKR